MSGAEVVIGLIAGVIGLLEAANKAYDTIKDIAGLPKAFEEVSQRIPLVLQILDHAKANAGQAPESTIAAITRVITSCKREAEDLRDILVKLANGDSGWDQNKYVQMVKCKGKKTRVEDLMKKIVENIQFLASDQTMKLATSQQLQELRLAVDGLTHVEPSAPDEVSGRGDSVTIHHSGNGPQNNHIDNSNSFTTWNNHGNGHMVQGNIYYGTPPETRESKVNGLIRSLFENTCFYEAGKDRNPIRAPGTCTWFLGHRTFEEWHAEQCSGLLWVSADPGCGKSVLARHLVDNVLPSSPSQTICYFFFKDDFQDQKSPTGAMCAILHQIFMVKPFLVSDETLDEFEKMGAKLTQSFSHLWDVLIALSHHHLAGQITCVIDAVDECEESGRIQMVDAISSFFSNPARPWALKFLLTSRMDGLMSRGLHNLESLVPTVHLHGEDEEEVEKIEKEINAVIASKVHDLSKRFNLRQEEAQLLGNELTSMPNRTYLWVYLVCDMIERGLGISSYAIQQIVRDIPSTVDEAYERILCRSTDARQARNLLHIVVGALRPLSLQEMSVAIAISGGCDPRDVRPQPETRSRDAIRILCGLFVTIVDSKVYLIHQTAKEFLQQSRSALPPPGNFVWKASFDPLESNQVLAGVCVKYLHFMAKFGSSFPPHLHSISDCTCETNCAEDSFLAYSVEFWTTHFRRSSPSDDSMTEELVTDLCNVDWAGCLVWLTSYNETMDPYRRISPSSFTSLILASYFGIETMVSKLVQKKNVQLNSKDNKHGRSALAWAAFNGHSTVVQELLNAADSIPIIRLFSRDRIDINSADVNGRTPLTLAADGGHEAVVRLLLHTNKADVDYKSDGGWTALASAADNGHEAIVRSLISTGKASVHSIIDRRALRPRYAWAEPLRKGIKLFAFVPFKTESQFLENHQLSPFRLAVIRGKTDVVKAFLELSDIDINGKGYQGRTALGHAAATGNEELVKLLLRSNKIIVDAMDMEGNTPLCLAAENGKVEVARLLLSTRNANINHMDSAGRTPLGLASQRGHKRVVQYLLELQEVDANLGHYAFVTPLSLALKQWDKSIVQALVDSGKVDPNYRDHNQKTALHFAAQFGQFGFVQDLLRIPMVDVHAKDERGRTPLHLAVEHSKIEAFEDSPFPPRLKGDRGCIDVVRLLLEVGKADVNAEDSRGLTALAIAEEKGLQHILEILSDF